MDATATPATKLTSTNHTWVTSAWKRVTGVVRPLSPARADRGAVSQGCDRGGGGGISWRYHRAALRGTHSPILSENARFLTPASRRDVYPLLTQPFSRSGSNISCSPGLGLDTGSPIPMVPLPLAGELTVRAVGAETAVLVMSSGKIECDETPRFICHSLTRRCSSAGVGRTTLTWSKLKLHIILLFFQRLLLCRTSICLWVLS